MTEFTPEYIENFHQIIARRDEPEAFKLLQDLHPADIAELHKELSLDESRIHIPVARQRESRRGIDGAGRGRPEKTVETSPLGDHCQTIHRPPRNRRRRRF